MFSNSELEVTLVIDGGPSRHVSLPVSVLVSSLREQLAMARSMANDSSPDAGSSTVYITADGQQPDDSATIGSLAVPGIPLVLRVVYVSGSLPDIGQITRRLRQVAAESVPQAQQRHMIQEHQRRSANAVLTAWARLPAAEKLKGSPSMFPDASGHHSLEPSNSPELASLLDCCKRMSALIDSAGTESVPASIAAHNFADSLLSVTSNLHSDPTSQASKVSSDSLATCLAASPIDPQHLFDGIVACAAQSSYSSPTASRLCTDELVDKLALALSNPSDRHEIAGALTALIVSSVSLFHLHSPDTPAGDAGLLPPPSIKASLSPDIVKWAQYLRAKERTNP